MKIIVTKDGKVFKDNTLLKPRLFKGYLRVKINGSTHLVHRLVALTYIPIPKINLVYVIRITIGLIIG